MCICFKIYGSILKMCGSVILLVVLVGIIFEKSWAEVAQQDCEVGADLTISQEVGGEGVVVNGNDIYYIPGGNVTVSINFTKGSVTLYALGLESWIPAGWKFLSLGSGSYNPQVYPKSGEISDGSNPFGFAWINTTNLPNSFSFSFNVEVPANEISQVNIVSRGLYRLTEGQICTNTDTTTFGGPAIVEGEGSLSEGEGSLSEGEGSLSEGEGSLSEGEGSLSEGEGNSSEGGFEGNLEGEELPDNPCGRIFLIVDCMSGKDNSGLRIWKSLGDILVILVIITLFSSHKKSL
ncbi:MAG: hypothetical protein N3G21_03635 [Candidatus Hydrogenedentes bacterium]|nr:hypothetical protein [Candidatus Hydrogenedentota bacterium]